jgi:anti-sigma-K factor RskA
MNGTPHDRTRLSPETWEAVEETLAAYALGALPAPDADGVARHLALCAACRAEVSGMAAAASLLPLTCEPAEPSPELRRRLLAAVDADTARARPGLQALPPARVAPTPAGRAAPTWRPWLLTAAAALLALGVGFSNVVLRQELREREGELALYESAARSWALSGTAAQEGARGVLVQPGTGAPMLLLQDLPALPADRAYQVWVIRGGQPVSVGVLPPRADGQQVLALNQPLGDAQAVAVSVEPAGGSPSPTGAVVLATNL